MIIIAVVEAEAPGVIITTAAGAKVIRGKGRNTNIKRVDTDAVTKVKTNMKATLPCLRIHLHLLGVIGGIIRKSANAVKIRRRSTTKEKRTNTTLNTKEREEIVIAVVAQAEDHRLRPMLTQYLQLHLELMSWQMLSKKSSHCTPQWLQSMKVAFLYFLFSWAVAQSTIYRICQTEILQDF